MEYKEVNTLIGKIETEKNRCYATGNFNKDYIASLDKALDALRYVRTFL